MVENLDANTAKTYATVGLAFYGLTTFIAIVVLNFSWPVLVSAGFTVWAYITYKKIDDGYYADARTSSLVLGIFGLFPLFGAFLGGIFFLLAYGKLGRVLWMTEVPPYSSMQTPVSTRFCVQCGRAVGLDNYFCAHCGAQLPK